MTPHTPASHQPAALCSHYDFSTLRLYPISPSAPAAGITSHTDSQRQTGTGPSQKDHVVWRLKSNLSTHPQMELSFARSHPLAPTITLLSLLTAALASLCCPVSLV